MPCRKGTDAAEVWRREICIHLKETNYEKYKDIKHAVFPVAKRAAAKLRW
ncbi:hypothetical protein GCM10007389_22700 [Pontibacter akesuensis]|nr:hypothetical protein GCM10007389_22700 [Pontibacter akesuensis]